MRKSKFPDYFLSGAADRGFHSGFCISEKITITINSHDSGKSTMSFFNSAVGVLQTLIVALGAGLGIWGAINRLEGYCNDNPGAKSQGMKQLMAGGGVAQGVYLAEDAWPDELYLLSLTNSRVVFSHETALFLHGLMEREPKCTSVTVKAGYNASHLRNKGIRVYQVKPDVANLGVTEVETGFGNKVRAYDKERTICDILRYKDSMDVQIFQYAMKEYMAGNQKNLNHLMAYAKKFQIEPVMRTYTEVML